MRSRTSGTHLAALLLGASTCLGSGCGAIKVDETASDYPPAGAIRGTLLYQGPRPCSRAGHIVGNAILLVFDGRNPPPPAGIATTPTNFISVAGDVLFSGEARNRTDTLYCPPETGPDSRLTATAAYTIAPLRAGSYIVQAFYDRTGDFLPAFKVRNLPRAGDVVGGFLDTDDALQHLDDVNYVPTYLPVDLGTREDGVLRMPPRGFIRDNVVVTLGARLALPRPYFHLAGTESPPSDADATHVPVLTFTQDHHLLAPPTAQADATASAYQAGFPALRLVSNLPAPEQRFGLDVGPGSPFHLQPSGGLFVWRNGAAFIPEGQLPELYPLVVLSKLDDDPARERDPQSVMAQGNAEKPIVLLQGVTLSKDSIFQSVLFPPDPSPIGAAPVPHVTVLVRPAAICIDATRPEAGGVLVSPFLRGKSADPAEAVPAGGKLLFDPALVLAHPRTQRLVKRITQGCLPTGRYAVNAVYPTGQAWTVPNEAGACAAIEGATSLGVPVGNCTLQRRPVLFSQGPRGVVEILPAADPAHCQAFPVPVACLRNGGGP